MPATTPQPRRHGRGRFTIDVLDAPPFYTGEQIVDLRDAVTNGGDSRITNMPEPAVNATSALLKGRGNEVSDTHARQGRRRIKGGIGDGRDGMRLRSLMQAINAANGHTVFDLDRLAANGVNLDEIIHVEYGAMQGVTDVISRDRPHIEKVVGVRVRDWLVNAHGGRSCVTLALQAMKEGLTKIWEEKRDAAHAVMDTAKATLDADPTNTTLIQIYEQAATFFKKFTRPKAGVVKKTWGTYRDIIEKILGIDSFVGIECKDGVPDPALIDQTCQDDPNIVFLVFCNPNNPTGKRMPGDVATDLCFVLARHQLFCHEDDIYASMSFVEQHRSLFWACGNLVSNPAAKAVAEWVACHTTMAVGWGKFGFSGGRHYTVIIPYLPLRRRFVGFMGAHNGPAANLSQQAILAMLENGDDVRAWHDINKKRIALCNALVELDDRISPWGVTLEWSGLDGGFYTWLRLIGIQGLKYINRNGREKVIDTSLQFAKFLVEKANMEIAPDSAALTVDPEGVRLAFGMLTLDDIAAIPGQVGDAIIEMCQANGRIARSVHLVTEAG